MGERGDGDSGGPVCRDEYQVVCGSDESHYCTPATNIIIYVN